MYALRAAGRSTRTTWLFVALAGVFALIALFIVTASAPSASASDPSSPNPTVVLVHGAWADSSGWSEVIRRLQRKDYRVLAPANPLRSLAGDSAYLASFLAQEQGPFVLVGHSYGGAVITNAADGNPNVKALVYVNGFVPDIGEDVLHLSGEGSLAPSAIEFKAIHNPPLGPTDFDVYIKAANFHETFAGDLSEKDAAVLAVTQRPIALDAGAGPTVATAWKTIPSWYLLGRQDRTITPAAQRFMANRAGSELVEINSSHLSMVSQPRAVVDLIEQAAAQVALDEDNE
jgi:pimeloyl-ACP methyl ester carboxylesterase